MQLIGVTTFSSGLPLPDRLPTERSASSPAVQGHTRCCHIILSCLIRFLMQGPSHIHVLRGIEDDSSRFRGFGLS